jgi:hypothetical protein
MDLPREEALRWLVAAYAGLRRRHGEVIGDPELLLPTSRHFPDPFRNDPPSVGRLLRRFLSYFPLDEDIGVKLHFVESDAGGGGCSSGSCDGAGAGAPGDRVIEAEDGYIVEIPVGDVGHPTLLTTSLARSVGTIVLLEAGEGPAARKGKDDGRGTMGAMGELAACVCGAGVLLSSGAYVYGKSCGGVRMHQHTHLSVEDHGVLLAMFSAVHGYKPGAAKAHLDTTQREAFAEGWAWVTSNDRLITDLRGRPELLEDGVFPIQPVKGLLARLFTKRADKEDDPVLAPAPRRAKRERTPEEQRRLAEARALVDQVLSPDAEGGE